MSSFTLADIRAAADKKYGPYDIKLDNGTDCRLVNAFRLSEEKRAELLAKQSELGDDDETKESVSQVQVLQDCIRIIAQSPQAAEELITEVGGDLGVLAEIFSGYADREELGEASTSAA